MYRYTDPYTVKQGDTLYNIAQQFDLVTDRQILRVNRGILNPHYIVPGQIIQIPRQTPMSTYIVQPMDTLGDILYSYNQEHLEIYGFSITLDELLAYNPAIISPNLIYPGMVIYLPEFL